MVVVRLLALTPIFGVSLPNTQPYKVPLHNGTEPRESGRFQPLIFHDTSHPSDNERIYSII